jgi:DNA repair exonuclease SbcCD ATPase subunit
VVEAQLYFRWYNKSRFIEKEIVLDIERIKAMLGAADRIQELVARREKIEDEYKQLDDERAEIDAELVQLTGQSAEPTRTRAKQKCPVCGSEGHSKRTCPQKGG